MSVPELPEKKRQRKLVAMEITETSLVDRPAHLCEGWVVLKSAGNATPAEPHNHLTDARYLSPRDEETANAYYGAETLKAGDSRTIYEGGVLGRDLCGCLHLTSKATIEKAASDSFSRHLAAAEAGRDQGFMLSKEDVAFMLQVKPEEL